MSTAGGLKTTTVAIIGLIAYSRLRGEHSISIWDRTIPEELSQRAVGLFVLGFGIVTTGIFMLITSEIDPDTLNSGNSLFLQYMFEAVSAFNTVGLSMGVTTSLTVGGKLILILLMFIGRVGPLAFSASLIMKGDKSKVRYRFAHEEVLLG